MEMRMSALEVVNNGDLVGGRLLAEPNGSFDWEREAPHLRVFADVSSFMFVVVGMIWELVVR
jgi:hypothetical protein